MEESKEYIDDFGQQVESMRDLGFNPYSERVHIAVPNARERLMGGLRYYLGDRAQWLPGYDQIAEWLGDNKGRGLLCIGNCGLGKTLICQNIIPVLIHQHAGLCPNAYTANEMNKNIDDILRKRIVIIDDLGTEAAEVSEYGNRRSPFNELCDSVERRGSILIITTNLRTTRAVDDKAASPTESIEERYGIRTLDRLRAITKPVQLLGPSLRC